MRDRVVEVRPAVDLEELRDQAKTLVGNIAETEALVERSNTQLAAWRLEMGKLLAAARGAFPRSGPKAAGWGKFLEEVGLTQQRAWEYMKLAGFIEQHGFIAGDETPSYRDAGLRRRQQTKTPVVGQNKGFTAGGETSNDHVPPQLRVAPRLAEHEHEDLPRSTCPAPKSAGQTTEPAPPAHGPKRHSADDARKQVYAYACAQSELVRIRQRGFSLVDLLSYPELFERASSLLHDVAGFVEEEMSRVEAELAMPKRAQLSVMKGGD